MQFLQCIGSVGLVALAGCATGGTGDFGDGDDAAAPSTVDAGSDVKGDGSGGHANGSGTPDASNGSGETGGGGDSGAETGGGSQDSGASDASSSADGSGSDAELPDSGPPDSATGCTAVAVSPAEPAHGDGACSNTGLCHPRSVTSFSPTWVPPLGSHVGACDAQQIATYFDQCFGSDGSPASCSAFVSSPANAGCVSCLDTPSTATSYGALIDNGVVVYVNVGGCVSLVEPCNLACAQAFEAVPQCSTAACDPTLYCSATSDYSVCEQASQNGTCACDGFVASGDCMKSIAVDGHPAFATCFGSQTNDFQALYTAVATFICGP
jgi:hypothetical protein